MYCREEVNVMMNAGNFSMPMQNPQQMQGFPQAQPVICPPQYRYFDQFTPRQVPVIHPIVNVNRQHVVDIPEHFYTETTENVMGAPLTEGRRGGMGSRGCGGCGNFGRRGRSPWM